MEKNSVFKLNEQQIQIQARDQFKFLKCIHPDLDHDQWSEGTMELRPIQRAGDYEHIRSYNTWRFESKDQNELVKFLKMINGKPYCLYYSSFAFDFKKEVLKENGGKYQKGKINNQNALYTTILAADFDNISDEEFFFDKARLEALGIETLDVASGHGFQSIIMLKEKVYDKEILRKFTELMIQKGFKVDSVLVDPARVLRMPNSFNCKAFAKKNKYYDAENPEALPTMVLKWTDTRYHVIDIFNKLQELPDIIPHKTFYELDNELSEMITTLLPEKKEDLEDDNHLGDEADSQVSIKSLSSEYKHLNVDILPNAVVNMLNGSQSGLRNASMLFLIPFLRNSIGLGLKEIIDTMTYWGIKCVPALMPEEVKSEVERIWKMNFKGKYGKYSGDLAKVFGLLDIGLVKNKDTVKIPNTVFEELDLISDREFVIYLAMKILKCEGNDIVTKEDIADFLGVSEKTVMRNLDQLLKLGHITKRKTNRREGQKYEYYVNPYFSTRYGYTAISIMNAEIMLDKLTSGEVKLLLYLKRMVGESSKECFAGQKYLAKKIGKKGHNAISMMTDQLHNKKFISKITHEHGNVKHCEYLLRF